MLLLLLAMTLGAAPAPDTVVVCPQELQESLEPWLVHRRGQGHVVEVLSSEDSAEDIRHSIRQSAAGGKLRFVVLVGDAPQFDEANPKSLEAAVNPLREDRHRPSLPAHYVKAKVNVHWGSEPLIASDNWYADLDDDELPDVAIGRLTADTPAELALIVRKILAYEASTNFGEWRSRINFVAGVGGFGVLADAVLETATRQVIAAGIPAAYATTMTFGNWRSPYCPDPRAFHQTTVDRLNEGSLFWVYIGHGHRWFLDRVYTPAGDHHILDVRDMRKLHCETGSPIALFLACYTAAFDGPYDCLAEELLRTEGAPVAILGGSRVTMPYGMAVLGAGMMDEVFRHRRETLGEVVLYAKQSLSKRGEPNGIRNALDMIGAAISPADLAEERLEHLHLMNLIGDPLLRLRYPNEIDIRTAATITAGQELSVSGESDIDGTCTIELVLRRGRFRTPPPDRRTYAKAVDDLAAYQQVYTQANDSRLVRTETVVTDGKFSAQLPVPADAIGQCHVRVSIVGPEASALGSANVEILEASAR